MTQIQRRADEPQGLARMIDNSDIKILDPHRGELVADRGRINQIATISLGYKSKAASGMPIPKPTRKEDERWLHPHQADNAPQLLAALEAGAYRKLTVSLAGNAWDEFVQQHFALYSTTALQVYGDEIALTYIHRVPMLDQNGAQLLDEKNEPRYEWEHTKVERDADPDKYARMLKVVKSQISIYFYLAEWEGSIETGYEPKIVFDGDVGLYRFRTTSLHTLDNLASAVRDVRKHTGGPLLGVPLELTVDFPEVADPSGHKRTIPTASFRFRPPFRFTAQAIRPMLSAAVQEGQALALPAPEREYLEAEFRESLEEGAADPELIEATEEDVAMLAAGGRCNAEHYRRAFFGLVRGSRFDDARERSVLIMDWCDYDGRNQTESLAELLEHSTNEQARRFIDWVAARIREDEKPTPPSGGDRPGDEYERRYNPEYEEARPAATAVVPSIRERTSSQPDGTLVDTESGEVVARPASPDPEPATAADDTPDGEESPTAEGGVLPPQDEPPAAWDDFPDPRDHRLPTGRDDTEVLERLAATRASKAEAPVPIGGIPMDTPDGDGAPGFMQPDPVAAMEELAGDVAGDDADDRPALTTAAEIWQEATNLGVVCDPPQSDWTDAQLTDYASGLMPRITAAEKGRARRAAKSQE